MDPFSIYNPPGITTLGDGIFDGQLPSGYTPFVHQQPANCIVSELSANGCFVTVTTSVAGADSWQWKATDGTNEMGPFTVDLEIVDT